MFTGIIEAKAKATLLKGNGKAKSFSLRLQLPSAMRKSLKKGDSVAVNGVCLTARSLGSDWVGCDLLQETLRSSNLGDFADGGLVNVESSLKAGRKIGGHFLTGHVDVTGCVDRIQRRGQDRILTVSFPLKFGKYLVSKGSVAMDGVSLTVMSAGVGNFAVHLIPHTLRATTLGSKKAGDRVNLEFDILAKYLWKWRNVRWGRR